LAVELIILLVILLVLVICFELQLGGNVDKRRSLDGNT
jgi:hypothetical protein